MNACLQDSKLLVYAAIQHEVLIFELLKQIESNDKETQLSMHLKVVIESDQAKNLALTYFGSSLSINDYNNLASNKAPHNSNLASVPTVRGATRVLQAKSRTVIFAL